MRHIRPALVDIYAHKSDPWAALTRWCTVDKLALSHTPVVLLDLDGGVFRGRQLVYSTPDEHPLGFIPRCPREGCDALPGDVTGNPSAHTKGDEHSRIRLRCKVCNYECWMIRPVWVKPVVCIGKYFFETPWPITEEQLREVLALDPSRWKLPVALQPSVSEIATPAVEHQSRSRGGRKHNKRRKGSNGEQL